MVNLLQSDQVNEIATALAAAQQEMAAVHKNAKNEYLGTTFADLAAVRAVAMPPLSKHFIAVTQAFVPSEGEPRSFTTTKKREGREYQVSVQILGYLRTQFTHSSGQWMASVIPLVCNWGDPHQLGGAITYLRRYALAAMCELAQDDDDGESAKGRVERQQKAQGQRRSAERSERFDDAKPVTKPAEAPPAPMAPTPVPPSAPRSDAAPVPAAAVAQAPANGQAQGPRAPERPKTGLQLSSYANDQKLDPDLKHWIVERYKHRGYPARIAEWTPDQVDASWPDIRDHLRRLQIAAQVTSKEAVTV
jgi:ERF superfamily